MGSHTCPTCHTFALPCVRARARATPCRSVFQKLSKKVWQVWQVWLMPVVIALLSATPFFLS